MPLQVGARLGHYAVTAKLGEGGMGEVWEATDTKLNRQVALKILPEAFAADPDRLTRFQREAQVLASLNHPNIAAIHGIEEAEGTKALVLELVEGPTLAELLERRKIEARSLKPGGAPSGALAVDEALPIAKQIAEALDAAHEAGIIHRDLKPANIKVTEDGVVKVLDFGLAKELGPSQDADPSASPTITAAATATGVLMGTAAYMSPEQARGKAVDQRTDVWAFGCVLYEMLTGRRAFLGDTVTDTLMSVLTGEIELASLPPTAPSAARWLLRRCLERDRTKRLRSLADGVLELDDDAPSHVGATTSSAVTPTPARQTWPWVAGIVAASLVTGLGVWSVRPASTPSSRDALAVTLSDDLRITTRARFGALSPDGRTLVYVGEQGGTTQLYRRPLDQLEAVVIPDTADALSPFFSPDGQWVGFMVDDQIRKVSLAGGASVAIGTVTVDPGEADNGLFWGEDDMVWMGGGREGFQRVPAAGGVPELVPVSYEALRDVARHWSPHLLPGGRGVLYARAVDPARSTVIAVYVPETAQHIELAEGYEPWFASSGHVVFSRGFDLWALPFDVNRLEATGEPVLVVEGVRGFDRPGEWGLSGNKAFVGTDGTLVYVPGSGPADNRRLIWVGRDGREEPIDAPPRPYRAPRVSPDGTRVAFVVIDGDNPDVYVHDLSRGTQTRLTSDPAIDRAPIWTPDGRHIVFASNRDRDDAGGFDLYWTLADGAGEVELFHTEPDRSIVPWSWSHDGEELLVNGLNMLRDTMWDIGTLRGTEQRQWVTLLEEYNEFYPEVDPDGQWLAYVQYIRGEGDRRRVYIQSFPSMDTQWMVDNDYQHDAAWSRDRGELFYRAGRNEGQRAMMAVAVDSQSQSPLGVTTRLFDDPYFRTALGKDWDVAPDGRFLMLTEERLAPPRQINIIRGWVNQLAERVPVN